MAEILEAPDSDRCKLYEDKVSYFMRSTTLFLSKMPGVMGKLLAELILDNFCKYVVNKFLIYIIL